MQTHSEYAIRTNGYLRLAQQVSLVRWIVPPSLALFVLSFELTEHTLVHSTPLDMDFLLELFVFGILGPILITVILTWIVRNLHELEHVHQAMHALNAELENKVALRTRELAHANEELRELDRLKSEFVSLVSHELRAPLTNIQGGLELMLSTTISCPPSQRNTLCIIQSEVKRLTRLVQRILDISVVDSGQLTLNRGPIALRTLLRQIIQNSVFLDKQHPVHLDLPPATQLVFADEDRLTDIISNLLQNAVKYSPAGGEIRIGLAFEDDMAHISIRDHGVGIKPEEIEHLTQQFYRGNSGSQADGYGLGLYFVNKLIELHGGQLQIESTGIPGEGSCFTFTVPLDQESLYELDFAY